MSWQKVKLGELCVMEKGNIGITKAIAGEYPLVVTSENRKSHNEYQFDDEAVIIPLVSSTGHGHKSLKRIHYQEGKFAVGSILCAVIPKDKSILNAHYLYRYLDLNKENELVARMKGMANVTLPMKEIANIEIPLPDIETQFQFVEKINSIEAIKDDLVAEQETQLTHLRLLRKQILSDAMQGKLDVPRIVGESGADLLASIHAEKAKTTNKAKPLPEIKMDDIPFTIPEHWVWCRLGDVCDFISGNNFNSADFKKGEGAKCIKITNAGVGEIIETDDVLPATFLEKYKSYLVFENDLVLALTRPYISDGLKISKCPNSYHKSLLNQRVAVIRPHKNIESSYIYRFLSSDYVLRLYKAQFDGKSQQPNLKKEDVTGLMLPLPPTSEQEAILHKIDSLMTHCDELETSIRQNQTYTQMLYQTALREALY